MEEKIILDKFSKRLSELIKDNNTDVSILTSNLGLRSKTTIYRYMKGEMSPKITTVKVIADIYNVNPLWLMGYEVPKSNKSIKIESDVFPSADTVIEIPVVGKISAGIPLLAVENIVSYAYAPSSQIKQDYTYFYLTVQGDSMNLKFHEGDIILVQKQSDLENDEIGVILINGEATVKKYKNENGLIILQPMSTNPEHQIQIYNPKEKDIEIIGKVISYQGKV